MGLEQRLFEINFMNIFLLGVASFVNTRLIPFLRKTRAADSPEICRLNVA
jgi:hypothetical protein